MMERLHTTVVGAPGGCRDAARRMREALQPTRRVLAFLGGQVAWVDKHDFDGLMSEAYRTACRNLRRDVSGPPDDARALAGALETYADQLDVVLRVMRKARQVARSHGFVVGPGSITKPASPTVAQITAWKMLSERVSEARQADTVAKSEWERAYRTHAVPEDRRGVTPICMGMPASWPPGDDDWPRPVPTQPGPVGYGPPAPSEREPRDPAPPAPRPAPAPAPAAPQDPSSAPPSSPAPAPSPAPEPLPGSEPPSRHGSGGSGGRGDGGVLGAPEPPGAPDPPRFPEPHPQPRPTELATPWGDNTDTDPSQRGVLTPWDQAIPDDTPVIEWPWDEELDELAAEPALLDLPPDHQLPETPTFLVTPDGDAYVLVPLPAEELAHPDLLALPIGPWGELT